MTDEINPDGDPVVVSAERFARLEQQVRDHIKVCDRLKDIAEEMKRVAATQTRWMMAQILVSVSTLIVLLRYINGV